eukprot:2552310-Amphidinium_carterae.1
MQPLGCMTSGKVLSHATPGDMQLMQPLDCKTSPEIMQLMQPKGCMTQDFPRGHATHATLVLHD